MKVTFLREPDEVAAQFHLAKPMLERVVDSAAHGEFSIDDLERLALAGRLTIGVVTDDDTPIMTVALEFISYPQYLVLNIVAFAGTHLRAVMREFWPALREFARLAGAAHIQASCSPAMARMLSRYGFEETYRTIRSAL